MVSRRLWSCEEEDACGVDALAGSWELTPVAFEGWRPGASEVESCGVTWLGVIHAGTANIIATLYAALNAIGSIYHITTNT